MYPSLAVLLEIRRHARLNSSLQSVPPSEVATENGHGLPGMLRTIVAARSTA
jgi:hypothetical protein